MSGGLWMCSTVAPPSSERSASRCSASPARRYSRTKPGAPRVLPSSSRNRTTSTPFTVSRRRCPRARGAMTLTACPARTRDSASDRTRTSCGYGLFSSNMATRSRRSDTPTGAATAPTRLCSVERHLVAAQLHRALRRLDHAHHAPRQRGMELHAVPGPDGADEVAELQAQRLIGVDLGRGDVAAAIGQMVFAESGRITVDDAAIEDPQRLGCPIVVGDHPLATDEDGPAQLARRQPAQLDVGNDAGCEIHGDEGHVCDSLDDRVAPDRADRGRKLAQPIQKDREVVRAQVPDNAHILLMEPEVHPARGNEVDVSQRASLEQALYRANRGAVDERVAAHQDAILVVRETGQVVSELA